MKDWESTSWVNAQFKQAVNLAYNVSSKEAEKRA